MTERNFTLIHEMERIALLHKATAAQIAIAWMLADPIITSPIIGATSIAQLNENLGAVEVHLTGEERESLNKITDWKTGGWI
jgi:aryl-alcohol dehydrogenase-like predicted oxidoreductase